MTNPRSFKIKTQSKKLHSQDLSSPSSSMQALNISQTLSKSLVISDAESGKSWPQSQGLMRVAVNKWLGVMPLECTDGEQAAHALLAGASPNSRSTSLPVKIAPPIDYQYGSSSKLPLRRAAMETVADTTNGDALAKGSHNKSGSKGCRDTFAR